MPTQKTTQINENYNLKCSETTLYCTKIILLMSNWTPAENLVLTL